VKIQGFLFWGLQIASVLGMIPNGSEIRDQRTWMNDPHHQGHPCKKAPRASPPWGPLAHLGGYL
jgi:hypothetical protein